VTYSRSITIPVTHACSNHCVYCGFRRDNGELLSIVEVEKILRKGYDYQCREALLMSGEYPESIEKIHNQLCSNDFFDFVEYLCCLCEVVLNMNFLPHVNVGVLSFEQLSRLRPFVASMGIMIENINEEFGRKVHPEKKIPARLKMLENSGELQIPFTTGILIGLGEPHIDRMRSLRAILEIHRQYDHIQEIIIQPFVPNLQSKIKQSEQISLEEYKELITFIKDNSDISVQIPPNLYPDYVQLIKAGVSDLGGISPEIDLINPEQPWPDPVDIRNRLKEEGYMLVERYPIYEKYINMGWYSEQVGKVIQAVESDKIFYESHT